MFNSKAHRIDYFYPSQLANERAPVYDIHFKPVEPFSRSRGIKVLILARVAAYGASFPFPLAPAEVGYLNGHPPFSLGSGNGSKCPLDSRS